jgi:hypothetical protein
VQLITKTPKFEAAQKLFVKLSGTGLKLKSATVYSLQSKMKNGDQSINT